MATDFRSGNAFPRRGRDVYGGYNWLVRVFDKARAAKAGGIDPLITSIRVRSTAPSSRFGHISERPLRRRARRVSAPDEPYSRLARRPRDAAAARQSEHLRPGGTRAQSRPARCRGRRRGLTCRSEPCSPPAASARVGRLKPEHREKQERHIAELRSSGAVARALHVGDRAPAFALPNGRGEIVSSAELLAGPLVVKSFFRGAWCPYCVAELEALDEIVPALHELGANLVVDHAAARRTYRRARRGERDPVRHPQRPGERRRRVLPRQLRIPGLSARALPRYSQARHRRAQR